MKIMNWIFAALLLLLVAGCNKSETENGTSNASDTNTPATTMTNTPVTTNNVTTNK